MPKVVNANIWHGLNSNVQLGACLTNSDVENIKALIKHLVTQALLPHVEKLIFQLNDIVSKFICFFKHSNTKSFFFPFTDFK